VEYDAIFLSVTPVIGVSSCRLQRQIPGATLFHYPGFFHLMVVDGAMDDEKNRLEMIQFAYCSCSSSGVGVPEMDGRTDIYLATRLFFAASP
jgi:hypothetical protein